MFFQNAAEVKGCPLNAFTNRHTRLYFHSQLIKNTKRRNTTLNSYLLHLYKNT